MNWTDLPWWLRLLAALAFIYLLILVALFLLQREMIYQPNTSPAEMPASLSRDHRAVTIETEDGEALEAWLHPPEADEMLILYLPGNAGDLADREVRFREFADGGYGILGISWRGYGGSTGSPDEAGLEIDARAGLAYAMDQLGLSQDRIIVFGESLGSGLAAWLGTQYELALVLLEAPYTSLPDVAATAYWWLPVQALMRDRYPSLERIAALKSPLLVIHGAEDRLIPPRMGVAVFEAAPMPKRFVLVPNQGHVMGLDRQLVLREIASSLAEAAALRSQ